MVDFSKLSYLTALTHLDGRNGPKLVGLRAYFSEFAWMRYRFQVMVAFLVALVRAGNFKKISPSELARLTTLSNNFSLIQAKIVQKEEAIIGHDLKALELYLTRILKRSSLSELVPFVNLGIGSEDINSIALATSLYESRGELLWPQLARVGQQLIRLAQAEKDTLTIGRTHAQPACPTTFGKEIANALLRLCDESETFRNLAFSAKISGEVGTFAAYAAIGRETDWLAFAADFVAAQGLTPSPAATQIAPYDSIVRYLQSLFRLNSILADLAQNIWLYVLLGYLKVKPKAAEVGSAGMPHKVNPIFFEGAEGGLAMANGIIETLARKLLTNRLQRDFSDSTLRRNLVLPLAYSLLSWQSLVTGFSRIAVDRQIIRRDLNLHGEIWIEIVKTYGLVHGVPEIYERLKQETRGKLVSQGDLLQLVGRLPLTPKEKQELTRLIYRRGDNPYPARVVAQALTRARKIFKL